MTLQRTFPSALQHSAVKSELGGSASAKRRKACDTQGRHASTLMFFKEGPRNYASTHLLLFAFLILSRFFSECCSLPKDLQASAGRPILGFWWVSLASLANIKQKKVRETRIGKWVGEVLAFYDI